MRSYGVPGPASTAPAAARISWAVRRIAASARSGLPLKWWYILPCPASARSRIALGLVPTYPRSHNSSRVDSMSRSEVLIPALYILVVTGVE